MALFAAAWFCLRPWCWDGIRNQDTGGKINLQWEGTL
jgi:hypothetical protein